MFRIKFPVLMCLFGCVVFGTACSINAVVSDHAVDSKSDYAETRVNTFTASSQSNSCLAIQRNGNTIVTWDSRRQQNGTYGIYLQRFSATGNRLGSETQVNLYTQNMQTKPAVATDGLDATWVAWESFGQDGSMNAIIARRFEGEAFTGSDEILVNETTKGQQSQVVVAGDSKGQATFVWTTPATEKHPQRIVFRRFDPSGQSIGAETFVDAAEFHQHLPTVSIDDQDRLTIAWAETDMSNRPRGIRARVFESDGIAISKTIQISPRDGQSHIEPAISAGSDRSFAVCWLRSNKQDYEVVFNRFNFAGERILPVTCVSPKNGSRISGATIAQADSGELVLAWNRGIDGGIKNESLVEARRFSRDGKAVGDYFQINQDSGSIRRMTSVSGTQRMAFDRHGHLAIAWNGNCADDEAAVGLTVKTPRARGFAIQAPEQFDGISASVEEVVARPHEPPTFDPLDIAIDRFGGDPSPLPQGNEFGFIGITASGWTPPDPTIAVGPGNLVATTNGAIAFFDKDGTKTFEDEIENSFGFWGSLGTDNFVFDPEVVFDPHSNRFFAMACERSDNGRSNFLLAVSDDDNPNGDWFKYRLDVTDLADNNIDSPNMAIDADAVYLTADFFGPDRYLIYMLDKADLLIGATPDTTNLLITGSQSYGIAVNYDANAPATYMIQGDEFATSTNLKLHALTDPLGTPNRVVTNVTVPAYGHPVDPPQLGTSSRPELFESRFWSCVYRNGSLWAVHHQSPNGTAAARARWYQFDMKGWPTSGDVPELVQSGDIQPDANTSTFFPSIWVDDEGNAAITFAKSSSTEFISMCRSLRAANDPLGEFRPLQVVRESLGSYSIGRWGDYSGTANDPAEPRTFWGIHEYSPGSNSWNTWIGKYEIPTSEIQVAVDNFAVSIGSVNSGGLPELSESDDQYVVLDPVFLSFRYQLVFTVDATSPSSAPAALEFNYESRAFNFVGTVDQEIELYNFVTEQFETIDSRPASATDSVVSVTPNGDPARFVQSGTNAMQARMSYQSSLPFWVFSTENLYLPYRVRADHIFWSITP